MKTQLIWGGVALALIVAIVLLYGNAKYNQGVSDTLASMKKDTTLNVHHDSIQAVYDSGFVASSKLVNVAGERPKRMREARVSVGPPRIEPEDMSASKLNALYAFVDTLTEKYLEAIQPDSMHVDKERYELKVIRDPQKPFNQRWWEWVRLKQFTIPDTNMTVTNTAYVTRFPWEAWTVATVAVILCILNILYGH